MPFKKLFVLKPDSRGYTISSSLFTIVFQVICKSCLLFFLLLYSLAFVVHWRIVWTLALYCHRLILFDAHFFPDSSPKLKKRKVIHLVVRLMTTISSFFRQVFQILNLLFRNKNENTDWVNDWHVNRWWVETLVEMGPIAENNRIDELNPAGCRGRELFTFVVLWSRLARIGNLILSW